MPSTVTLSGQPLTIDQVISVCREQSNGSRATVSVSPDALARIDASRAVVERRSNESHAHYGINTGFGSLARTRIAPGQLRDLQRNLIRSHAAGIGEPLDDEVVRAMMLLLAASLCRGKSGVRPELVLLLVDMLNRGVMPVVPSVGSVGASGDLAPLASIALVMIGEGHARFKHAPSQPAGSSPPPVVIGGAEALTRAGLKPIELEAKEGLALINGTHLMGALGCICCHDARVLLDHAIRACAMSIDACRASHAFLDERVHAARGQPGQIEVASLLRGMLAASQIVESHRENDPRVQDPYCLRCAPQVLGASLDCLSYVKLCVERELGAVTDNPLVLSDDVVSAGNFHGMPLAIPLDAATIALAHIAGISERRTFWLLAGHDPQSGLPPYLARGAGVSSGLMIAQYTAAACCNEIISLCTPASVSNIVTSAGIEDYNSFGPRAGMKALRALDLARRVVAIELICAAEGLEFQRPLRSGEGVERAYEFVRRVVPPHHSDRPPGPDIEALARAMA